METALVFSNSEAIKSAKVVWSGPDERGEYVQYRAVVGKYGVVHLGFSISQDKLYGMGVQSKQSNSFPMGCFLSFSPTNNDLEFYFARVNENGRPIGDRIRIWEAEKNKNFGEIDVIALVFEVVMESLGKSPLDKAQRRIMYAVLEGFQEEVVSPAGRRWADLHKEAQERYDALAPVEDRVFKGVSKGMKEFLHGLRGVNKIEILEALSESQPPHREAAWNELSGSFRIKRRTFDTAWDLYVSIRDGE